MRLKFCLRVALGSMLMATFGPAKGAAQSINDPLFAAGFFISATGRTGSDLKSHLTTLIDDHTALSYTPGVWNAHKDLYEDPANSSNIVLFYSGASIDKSLQDSSSPSNYWNREHLWPNSYGIDDAMPRYTDIFNLVPAYKGVNSARGNKHFDETPTSTTAAHPFAPDCRSDDNSWEPADPQKGWAARALFYMTTRYSDMQLVNISQSASLSTAEKKMAQLDVMLDWNRRFLPSAKERDVNHRIYRDYQNNRNPYIDFPEFADAVWVGHPSWGNWRLAYFTLGELLVPEISGDNADPDQDGLSNLMEMALYTDPRSPTNALLSGTLEHSGPSMVLSFPQASSTAALNLTLVLEVSSDLETWTEVPLASATLSAGQNPYQNTVSVTRSLGPGEREFYRLRATR